MCRRPKRGGVETGDCFGGTFFSVYLQNSKLETGDPCTAWRKGGGVETGDPQFAKNAKIEKGGVEAVIPSLLI